MNRIVASVIFGVGVVVLIAGVAKVLPGGISTGGAIAFLGALLFGLSFIPRPEGAPNAPAPLSAFERISGMFFEPTRVFQNLRAHPRWLAALLVMAFCSLLYTTAFTQRMTPERIVGHMTEKLTQGGWVPAEAAEKMKEQQLDDARSVPKRIGAAVTQSVGLFVLMAFLAALYLLLILMFGGRINFWQALSVAVHAALPIFVIQKLLSLVLLYVKSPDDIHPILGQNSLLQDNLGVLFSPANHPVLFVAASFIGVLAFYSLWLTATGLRNGGDSVSKGAAWTCAITIWTLGLLFSVVSTMLFPGFIS
ncbi:MAG TPA: YIP1 family protein [Pyrinomonadaceae bacterium]|nr:YIP1 family protein [Pyrinomonadaceae bacterium]